MATYTSLSNTELNKCVATYGITQVLDYVPIAGGNANSSFLVSTARGKFVLTIMEERNVEQARDLARLLQHLDSCNFATSQVCLTDSGQAISVYNGKPILLKQWITGRVVEDMSADMLKETGAALARLHQLPIPDVVPHEHPFGVETFSALFDKKMDLEYESWLRQQQLSIISNIPPNLPKGMIHGDLFFDNVLFEADKLKAIIDFEEACYYYCGFDIGMSIVGLCKDSGQVNWAKVKSLLQGYEQVRPLEPAEKESIQFFTAYAATATSSWRYWKYNFDTPQKERKDKHWEMVNLAKEIGGIKPDDLLASIFK